MKVFVCLLALATVANAGLLHHAPAPLSLSHGGGSQLVNVVHLQDGGLGGHGGGLSYGGGLDGAVDLGGLSHGGSYGGLDGGLSLGGSYGGHHEVLGGGHQVVRVIHQQQAQVLAPAPQLVKVIHQQAPIIHHAPAPAHLKVIRVINQAPAIHHHAPASLKIVKVLHQAPQYHHIPAVSGW